MTTQSPWPGQPSAGGRGQPPGAAVRLSTPAPTGGQPAATGAQPTVDSPAGRGGGTDRAVPGTLVGGRYELRSPIGHGGMGTVWRATDTLLRREVAVKEVVLPPTMPRHERDALCERTMREARAAAALSHPSVVQVYDVVTDGDRPWIVMELLDARSLADMVIDDGPLPARAVAKIGIAILGALEVAHAAGVLHRDVKPANVLIGKDGRCVLTDFGVARLPTDSKLTTPGMVLGSPHFISPERAVGGNFGPPSDLFSLGVTLYTAIEGGPPFDRGDPFETMRAVVEESPRPARLAGPLKPVLWGLLEKDPDRRWTIEQTRTALRELLAGPLARPSPVRADTDPFAVIRTPEEPAPPRPGSQVGGSAMLDPDEPLDAQIAQRAATAGPAPAADQDGGLGQLRVMPRSPVPSAPPARREGGAGRRRAPSRLAVLLGRRGAGRAATDRPRTFAGSAWLIVLMVALLGIVAAVIVWPRPSAQAPPGPSGSGTADPSASPSATPLIDVQEYVDDRGFALNVPAGWEASRASSYVDYTAPGGALRVRINVEPAGATATRFLEVAENQLKRRSTCPTPYVRITLAEATIGGQAGAELEYTCGEQDEQRHGIWGAIVRDGQAYHFYFTAPEAQFAANKIIFDEMVRSFRFT